MRVAAAGLDHELRRGAPGPALVLGDQAAERPAHAVGEAPGQAQRAEAARAAASRRRRGLRRSRWRPARRCRRRARGRRASAVLGGRFERRRRRRPAAAPARAPPSPAPSGACAASASATRAAPRSRPAPAAPDCLLADRASRLSVNSESRFGSTVMCCAAEGSWPVLTARSVYEPGGSAAQHELSLAVGQRDQVAAADALAEDRNDGTGDGHTSGALDPADDAAVVGAGGQSGGRAAWRHRRAHPRRRQELNALSSRGMKGPVGKVDRSSGPGRCQQLRRPVRFMRRRGLVCYKGEQACPESTTSPFRSPRA